MLRLGHVPTGKENTPPQPEGSGLECDKLSQEAVEFHFAHFLKKLKPDTIQTKGSAFSHAHIDSWEVGYQNWTPRFREEFQARRGYDPLRYLPAFSGRVVENLEISERFLWDVRRTIADLVTDNYAGRMAALAHQHRLRLSIEAYASLGSGPFDSLDYGGQADVPMGEFWNETDESVHFHPCRIMASAAHTYGKPVVAAEAFSAWPAESKWQEHPAALKRLADAAFCEGVNRLVLQSHAQQPWLNRRPGMTFGFWGLHYDRNQTWWEYSKPWHDYLARCQFLLQRGLAVADICYLTQEGGFAALPNRSQLVPPPPEGRDYDLVSPKVVLDRMTVKDGRLVLPDGMSYRLMILPPTDTMTPPLLRKLAALVKGGATVIGPRPQKSPSLVGYPNCDTEVKELVNELWGDINGRTIQEHRVGIGLVVWGKSIGDVFRSLQLPKDFQQTGRTTDLPLRWIHRTDAGAQVYFVANPGSQPGTAECVFRVSGKHPELWWPESGKIEKAAVWEERDGVTRLPIQFEPTGSVFVVFREPSAGADPIVSVLRNGSRSMASQVVLNADAQPQLLVTEPGVYELKSVSGKLLRFEVTKRPAPMLITGPWELRFPPNWGAPERVILDKLISWTEHRDLGVKYFSGTATYHKTFQFPAAAVTTQRRWFLDLGNVRVIAEIWLNGKPLGILWKPPFRVDVSDALLAGANQLAVQVVNLWPNRLIGDEQRPDDCRWLPEVNGNGQALAEWPQWLLDGKPSPTGRFTFSTWKHWQNNSPLLSSGLLGSVELQAVEQITPR